MLSSPIFGAATRPTPPCNAVQTTLGATPDPESAPPMTNPTPPPSIVTPQRVRWTILNRVNPIRGLEPSRLAYWLENYHAGYLREASMLWDQIERRDPTVQTVVSKRKKAVSRLSWEIVPMDDSPEAQAHADVLRETYNNLRVTDALRGNERGGVRLLVRQMMDAVGKGYAVHELVWGGVPDGTRGVRVTAQFCPLWFFEATLGRLRYLPTEFATTGQDMDPMGWMVTTGDGIMEATSVAWMVQHLSMQDWLAFSERFGMPGVLGKTQAPQGSDQWTAMEEAVAAIGQDMAAVMSQGDTIETFEARASGSTLPYPPLIEACQRRIAALWRGADMSTMSAANSTGASLQGDEAEMLLEDDVATINDTLNEQLDRHVISLVFGDGVEPLAAFKLQRPTPTNTYVDVAVDRFLVDYGVPISKADIAERYGRSLASDGAEVLVTPAAGPGLGVAPQMANDQIAAGVNPEDLARAMASDLAPVRARIERILNISDPVIQRERMTALISEFPSLLRDINADPAAGPVLVERIGQALARGIQTASRPGATPAPLSA